MDKILLVEDDSDIREILALYLRKEGFDVTEAGDGTSALRLLREQLPDLLLTDILLPDIEGTELTRWIRSHSDIPVILISCQKESASIVKGFQLGADDYITKPFEPAVVVARIRSQLRRYRTMEAERDRPVLSDGYLEIRTDISSVKTGGREVHLFTKERQLLLLFARHPNTVFRNEQLFEQLWGTDHSSDPRTVMVHIRNLRKKIEKNPAAPAYIVTVRGFGYKFCWNGNKGS